MELLLLLLTIGSLNLMVQALFYGENPMVVMVMILQILSNKHLMVAISLLDILHLMIVLSGIENTLSLLAVLTIGL